MNLATHLNPNTIKISLSISLINLHVNVAQKANTMYSPDHLQCNKELPKIVE